MAEAEIEVVVAEAEEFQEEAQKVVTIANQAKKKTSEKQECTVDDKVIELLLTPSEGNESLLEKQVSECFSNLIYSQIELSPREQMMAFVPKNKGEEALKQATILRYKLEDFVEKHPEAAELCSKMFIGVIYALQGIEYGVAGYLAGPVGIAAKFATQATTAFAIDTTIEESSDQAARFITQVETLQQEFKNTIKFCTYAGLCAGSVKAGKKLISSLARTKITNPCSLPVDQHAKVNQAPYDPRNAQGLASELLESADFTRTTVPGYNMPNVRLAGRCKERTIVVNPETHETLVQRVVFDQRGFPIFDPYVKVETRISGDLTHMRSEQHMKLATQQLKRNILSGQLDGHSFTTKQLNAIMKEYERIPGFVWHHHQEIGRMQLVPRDIHAWIKHVGGNSSQMWGTGR